MTNKNVHRKNEADFIKLQRNKNGLTQAQLARAVGKTAKQYIANIESGKHGVPIWMLESFAKALEVKVEKLISLRLKAYAEEIDVSVFAKKRRKK